MPYFVMTTPFFRLFSAASSSRAQGRGSDERSTWGRTVRSRAPSCRRPTSDRLPRGSRVLGLRVAAGEQVAILDRLPRDPVVREEPPRPSAPCASSLSSSLLRTQRPLSRPAAQRRLRPPQLAYRAAALPRGASRGRPMEIGAVSERRGQRLAHVIWPPFSPSAFRTWRSVGIERHRLTSPPHERASIHRAALPLRSVIGSSARRFPLYSRPASSEDAAAAALLALTLCAQVHLQRSRPEPATRSPTAA